MRGDRETAATSRPAGRAWSRPSSRHWARSGSDELGDQVSAIVDLRAGFARLSRPDRDLLYMYYVDDVSVLDLSTRYGASRNTVHQRLVRARDHLRRAVEVGLGEVLRRRWQARRRRDHAR